MDIKKLIEEIHGDAIKKGWYDCPECKGVGDNGETNPRLKELCHNCQSTGIDPNRNIGEMLMLVVSELSEALEAHRCGKFCKLDISDFELPAYQDDSEIKSEIGRFEFWVKDTFEDEIADVFIRLFDFMAYMDIPLNEDFFKCGYDSDPTKRIKENIGDELMVLVTEITALNSTHEIYQEKKGSCTANFGYLIKRMETACDKWNIPIEKHITAKMAYNRTRPYKHGKEY